MNLLTELTSKGLSITLAHLPGLSPGRTLFGRRFRAPLGIRGGAAATLASLFLLSAPHTRAAQRLVVQGHVPAAVASLRPAGRLPGTNRLALAIGLPLRNREELAGLLEQLSDPASPHYGHYLTPEQFAERFGPAEQDYQALVAFVTTNGLTITGTHSNRTLLDVSGSVADIERVFQVTMRVYPHPREARTFFAPEAEPSLGLAVPVLHISGLDDYSVPRPMSLKRHLLGNNTGAGPALGSGPAGTYMGADFRAAYVPGISNLIGAGQSVGLVEFDGYYLSDITNYIAQAGLPNVPLKTVLLDGFDGAAGSGNIEVALDIDMAMSMAPGLSAVIVYEGLLPDSVLNRMATDNLAKELSASWTYSIDATTEQIFQQFAAQGQSFFNASGDGDAWVGAIYSPCDDPYITIVGGTTLTNAGPAGAWVSETVWNWGVEYGSADDGVGSGGGVSTGYSIPSWQRNISMTLNQGSTTMRNIPDVAMVADYIYVIADNGVEYWVGGTSAATPLWAGFIALVNQQAAANSQPPVGFINPAIYTIGKGTNYANCFHDITTGDNTWSSSLNKFYAVSGYDLCTGWGTPKGAALINALAPPSPLQIAPGTGFAAGGPPGGPFNGGSQRYVLTNAGTTALSWTLANTASWLSVFPGSGMLSPGGPATNVTVSLNAASSNLAVGVYSASVWFTNMTDSKVQSRPFTLVVLEPPMITSQPTNQTVLGGTTVAFSVAATGWLPLSYQWQADGTNLTDAGNIHGSAASTLTISNVSPANAQTYSVIVSNVTGMTASSNALLTIIPSGPVITLQPVSQNLLFGATARFTVAALGSPPLSYQWQDNGTNLSDGGNVSGSARSSLTISNVSAANIGTYSVLISNGLGSLMSMGATLAVQLAQPSAPLVQNGGFEAGSFASWAASGNFDDCSVSASSSCVHSGSYGALLGPAGSPGYLSQVLPTSPGMPYLLSLWLNSPDGVGPNEFMVAWNGITLFDQSNLPAVGWTNLQFFVTATGADAVVQIGFRDDGSFLGLDDISLLPVLSAGDSPPVIMVQPVSQTVAMAGSNVTWNIVAGGKLPLSYQWQLNGTSLADATDALLTLAGLTTNQAGTYNVVVTNALGSTISSNAVLTVLPTVPDYFTEWFAASPHTNDLAYRSFSFTPDGSYNYYAVCQQTVSAFPTDPTGGTTVSLTDDSYAQVTLSGTNTVAIYNRRTNVFFIGSNGYLTMDSGDTAYLPTYTAHFNRPRISAWFRDLNPGAGGTVSWKQLSDRAVVTYQNVPEYGTTESNSFQVALFYDGRIRVTYLQMAAQYGLVGLSAGQGVPTLLFAPSDFSAYSTCVVLPPVIVAQPTNVAVLRGSDATFSVAATGTPPLSYQWRFDSTNISGATLSSFTKTNVQLTNAGSYSVFISNDGGSVASSNAVLSLLLPPSISAGPTNTLVGLGLDATFAVIANGTPPLAYQWQFNGTNLNGATASSLTISNAQAVNAGSYRIVLTNLYGTTASPNASLTVQDPFIVSQPQSQSVAAGAPASFSVGAIGTLPLSYQWLKQGLPLMDGGSISGARTYTLIVSNVQAADMANYSVVVSNVNGWVTSSNAALVGPFAPVIATQPASQKVLAGSAASFTVGALSSGSLSYQWRQGGTNLADGGKISGSATASLAVSNVQAAEMGNYSVVVSNVYGPMVSSNALLALWPLVSWGYDAYSQTDVPAGLSNVIGVAEGHYHSLALNGDGTVVAWGAGTDYTPTVPHYGQSVVPAGLSNVTGVAGGYYHSLALSSDGTVVAWGASTNDVGTSPNYGQALVPGLLSNVTAVAGGAYHSLALKADGTVAAWGAGTNNTGANPYYGQSQVPAGLSNVVAIAAGAYHSLALKADGTLLAWGAGTANTGSSPDYGQAQVPAGLSNVVAIAAGVYHSLALVADGSLVVWGANTYGQTHIPNGLSNVIAVGAGGGYHVLVLEGDGRPHLTVQPVSRAEPVGATLSFTAMAVGAQPLSYQWQCNGTNLMDDEHIVASHSSTLTVTNALAANSGSYRLFITNAYGSSVSALATLTVPVVPVPVFQLPLLVQSNHVLSFTWTAAPGQAYQMQYKNTLTETNWLNLGTPISAIGATASAWDTATNAQRFYRVILVP